MVLKDWKKINDKEENMIYFINKKNGNVIYVINMQNKKHDVAISEGEYILPSALKTFKTKSQAMRYARQYMRTH